MQQISLFAVFATNWYDWTVITALEFLLHCISFWQYERCKKKINIVSSLLYVYTICFKIFANWRVITYRSLFCVSSLLWDEKFILFIFSYVLKGAISFVEWLLSSYCCVHRRVIVICLFKCKQYNFRWHQVHIGNWICLEYT